MTKQTTIVVIGSLRINSDTAQNYKYVFGPHRVLCLVSKTRLTLKAPITTAADYIFIIIIIIIIFQRKQVLTFHVNHLLVFSEK